LKAVKFGPVLGTFFFIVFFSWSHTERSTETGPTSVTVGHPTCDGIILF